MYIEWIGGSMENTVGQEKKKNKGIFALKIVGNVIFYLIIIVLLLFSIMNINAGSKNGGFPNIFGRGFLSVQSNSMTRLGDAPSEFDDFEIQDFAKGDLLNVKVINSKNINTLKMGDVITFYDENLEALNSHRIVYLSLNADNTINSISVQGDLSVTTKGLYDRSENGDSALNASLIGSGDIQTFTVDSFDDIKGVVTSVNVGGGKVLDNIQKNWLWYFVLPVLLFLLFEVFMVVRNVMELKGSKQKAALATDKEALLAEVEAQKEEIRKQLLAELQAQGVVPAQTEQPNEEPKEIIEEVAPIIVATEAIEDVQPEIVEEPVVENNQSEIVEEPVAQEAQSEIVEDSVAEDVQPEVVQESAEEAPIVEAVEATPVATTETPVKKPGRPKGTTTAAKKTTTAAKKTTTTAKKTTSTAAKKATTKDEA